MSLSRRVISEPMSPMTGNNGDAGYGAQHTLRLPVARTYRNFKFDLVNLDIDQILEVSLTLDGETVVQTTGPELDMLRKAKGEYTRDDVLVLPFCDTTQLMPAMQSWSSLVTLATENLILKIRTGPRKAAQAGKAAFINGRYDRLRVGLKTRLVLPRIMSDGMAADRSGQNKYDKLVRLNRAGSEVMIQRIFFMNPNIEKAKVTVNGVTNYEKTLEQNNFDLREKGQVPPDGIFLLDSVSEGFGDLDSLPDVDGVEFDLSITVPGSFNAVFQYVQLLPEPVTAMSA